SDDIRADHYLLKDAYVGNEMNEVVTYGTGLPAGTYYIEIDDLRSKGAQYQFTVTYKESNFYEKELNDKVSSANTISVNTFFHGNLMSNTDEDWYTFSLSTPGYVSFSFSHDFEDESWVYWGLSLYSSKDLNDELLYREYIGNEMNEVTSYGTGLPAGQYFIKVENRHWSNVQYNFKVNFTKSSYYEKERNDGIASADPILLNTLYRGNIMDTHDEDVYKFVLEKTGNISIMFSHDFVDSRTTYWKLYMYNMNDLNSEILEYKYSGNTKDPVVGGQTYLKAGTYYIKITRDWESNVSYRFSVNTPMNKLTASNTSGGIRLSYSKVKNATKYLIYRNNSLIATVTGDSAATYTDKNKLKNGTKYTYKVVAVTNTSPRISKSVVIYRLSGGKITSAKNVKGRKMKVSWKKNSKASGYQIQYSTRSDFSSNKKTVNIKGKSTVSKKISKLTRGKKYYVRERAYKKSGGKKYYSAWSAVKKVTISK
ncbi:MAG: fibronectin type III domain-containing protein, partial [Lachnospiraceae bacterium]|nr:fibronectin type III domain-containing protein [Lachnospiraceae bacterium]